MSMINSLNKNYDVFVVSHGDIETGIRRFKKISDIIHNATHIHGADNVISAIQRARVLSKSEMYWLITDNLQLDTVPNLSWKPRIWDRKYPHIWPTTDAQGKTVDEFSGVYLIPTDYIVSAEEESQGWLNVSKDVDSPIAAMVPYDVFFISYNEVNADDNWDLLIKYCPRAKRVDGITGIHNAHRRCAELSETSMFWTIDADSVLIDGFDLSWTPSVYDRQYLHIWHTINPVNNLSYGYGAIKLWPVSSVIDFRGEWIDFTTSVGQVKLIEEVASVTNFNTDPFSSWKSGFRETVKLSMQVSSKKDSQSLDRLVTWLNKTNTVSYGSDTVWGARDGLQYYLTNRDNHDELRMINDFNYLKNIYAKTTKPSFLGVDLTHSIVENLLGDINV
jgi:hypothetical protein